MLRNSEIEPATIGGTWYPKLFRPGGETTVILHFHGGSFLWGLADSMTVEWLRHKS